MYKKKFITDFKQKADIFNHFLVNSVYIVKEK